MDMGRRSLQMALENHNILITGSNGGLGLGIIKYLLNQGLRNIACHYRNKKEEISNLLAEYDLDPNKQTFYADLNEESDIHRMRNQIEDNLGEINTLVNLAGGSSNGMSWKLSKEQFLEVINNNLLSTFLCSKEFIPSMRENNFGTIINTSSIVSAMGVVGASHYCAAKAGINGLTKSMSLELANKNITVNTLTLGYFNTGIINHVPTEFQEKIISQTPLKRFGDPSEIGALIKYLMSNEARFTTGQTFHINGGLY